MRAILEREGGKPELAGGSGNTGQIPAWSTSEFHNGRLVAPWPSLVSLFIMPSLEMATGLLHSKMLLRMEERSGRCTNAGRERLAPAPQCWLLMLIGSR